MTILFSETSQTSFFFFLFLLTRFTLTSSFIHIQMLELRRLIESTREREREREKVYARVLSSVYDSRVNEILIWQKNLTYFQHENIHILPNMISIIIALFDRFLLELNLLSIFDQYDWIYICKRRWQLFYWYSMLNILHDYIDDVISHFNKKITSKHTYRIHKIEANIFVYSHDVDVCFHQKK
jgi:hypothetical protein